MPTPPRKKAFSAQKKSASGDLNAVGDLYIASLRGLPRRTVSRVAGRLMGAPSKWAARGFAAAYRIDMQDAEQPIDAYGSIYELFTRRLAPGARPIAKGEGIVNAPVDGLVQQRGPVDEESLPQAKGRSFTLDALLAGAVEASTFAGGSFMTLYLSPRDYHRIHAPVRGRIHSWRHVPGDLFPVNAYSTDRVESLFARNERLLTLLEDTPAGRVAVVKVGAIVVGRIRPSYAPEIMTNLPEVREMRFGRLEPPVEVSAGDELGVFELGSTVIVVTERPVLFDVGVGDRVRMGQSLGTVEL